MKRIGLMLCVVVCIGGLSAHSAAAAEAPLATTGATTSLTTTSVALSGKVNPSGGAVAICRFEYGVDSRYGAVVPCTPASLGTGTLNVSVAGSVGDLEPGTTYRYRLVASGAAGGTVGEERSFVTPGAPACSNVERRVEQGIQAIQLPDCMALEQVNPPRKLSQRAASPTIAAGGERIAFRTLTALPGALGNLDTLSGDVYLASRTGSGWSTESTTPPWPLTKGWTNASDIARSFDPELRRWVVMGSSHAEYELGVSRLFRGASGGILSAISPLLSPINGIFTQANVTSSNLQGAAADHSRLFFAMGDKSARYLPGDPEVGAGADRNIYVAQLSPPSAPTLSLLARDDDGKTWGENCGARIGGIGESWRNQGAVSANGSRVLFSTRPGQAPSEACQAGVNKLRIMERTEGPGINIKELFSSECDRVAPACSTEDGDDFYQGASVDGSRVYFTTNRQLADSDRDGLGIGCLGVFGVPGCDLYLYDANKPPGERLTQVSAGEASGLHPVAGEGANVLDGTVAVSGDGSRVYFVAAGVLTLNPSPEGRLASEYPTDNKLYTWDAGSGALSFIGALSAADEPLWHGAGTFLNQAYPVPATGKDSLGREIGGDGRVLAFQARASLTANDGDGGRIDTFRYDSEATPPALECVSCRPGGVDAEPFDVVFRIAGGKPEVPGTGFAEYGRWVSEDGKSVLIRTSESLLPADMNTTRDDYLWKDGDLTLLPGTATPEVLLATLGDEPPVLSHDGSEVAFTAYTKLLPTDIDTAPDVYVARVGGGFPLPVARPVCRGEGCQGAPAAPPAEPLAGTPEYRGMGNVPPPKSSQRCPKGKRKVVRNGATRCVKPRSNQGKSTKQGKKKRAAKNQGGKK